MKLLIHDLSAAEWAEVAQRFEGWSVVSDDGGIRPCMGCFGCWVKTPGRCVLNDAYAHMPRLLAEADEVLVMSRYTYGGFSSFVKNVFDRSIGYVLPFFEVVDGEMHHKARCSSKVPVSFGFRGEGLTEMDKLRARVYVQAVCRNLRRPLGDLRFEECAMRVPEAHDQAPQGTPLSGTVLLNCSPKGDRASTRRFLDRLAGCIDGEVTTRTLPVVRQRLDEFVANLAGFERLVLGMPLYVDGIPAQVLRLMELLEAREAGSGKKVYVVANMGLYECWQLKNLMGMVRAWCSQAGFRYCGGIAIGAGPMFGPMIDGLPLDKGLAKNIGTGMRSLARAIESGTAMDDCYASPHLFPRALYLLAANAGWPRNAVANGIKRRDLYQLPS